MRLLYVIDSLTPGGAETSLAEMAPGLITNGIELHVMPLGSRLDLASRLERAGAIVHQRAAPSQGRINNVRSIVEVARSSKPALIHTTLYEADIAGRIAARLLAVPSSTSIVNDSYSPSHYRESNTLKLHAARTLDAATSLFAERFHSITNAIADSVAPRIGIPRNKIDVIPRGRDPQLFHFQPTETRRRLRTELGIADTTKVILAVGRQEPQKGHTHLLDALPTLTASHPSVTLLFAGKEGRSSQPLLAQARQANCDVRFLGHRNDVADLLAAADVFCFPSEREGFGGALLEAIAVGCPVVASDIPTTREVLGDTSPTAVLTPVGNAIALGEGLSKVLASPSLGREMVVAARQRFEEHFTLEAVTTQMHRFFNAVVNDDD